MEARNRAVKNINSSTFVVSLLCCLAFNRRVSHTARNADSSVKGSIGEAVKRNSLSALSPKEHKAFQRER